MTITMITIVLGVLLAYFNYKFIHKYNHYIYLLVAIISYIFGDGANIITLGFIPLGIFLIVAFTGALSKGKIRKRLNMVRAEYATIASIFVIPHISNYVGFYFANIFPQVANASKVFGFLAFVLLIPLTITSFQFIRRRFTYPQWKKLHRLAYFFYLFVILHLVLLRNDRFYLYLIISLFYVGLKIPDVVNWYQKRQKSKKKNSIQMNWVFLCE